MWLDPMPVPEDLGKAYLQYYTHASQDTGSKGGVLKQAYRRMVRSYLRRNYGYYGGASILSDIFLSTALRFFPNRRYMADQSVRYLRHVPGGRILDVGCGAGEWIGSMTKLGWSVDGVDFDEGAVMAANRAGLEVRCGSLEGQCYETDSFDAVTLNHVIEHVPDPVGTLSECCRVLKPSGKLVLFTPNTASLAHRLFGGDWRGLEPPRHLHLFCPKSMKSLLLKSGFTDFSVRTVNSKYVWRQSYSLWSGDVKSGVGRADTLLKRVVPAVLAMIEQPLLWPNSALGECLAVQAVKD